MKVKIYVTISIFVLLFSFGWLLNQKQKREFYLPVLNQETLEILQINNELEAEIKQKIRAFQPREYVRVERN
ncbi:hypothetical protein QNH39_02035 [Neobacillus novalis]|uniref:Uncharacterized protein n=1 Tax=Neobacillus novalis TaxID=220687 RepID=A0AA95SBA5_9BACI|nr:hypothetical protein [Neobacillus novalis]WHY86682.1 hypothetical protein QNH39_02035 [Neobacillus novalis]